MKVYRLPSRIRALAFDMDLTLYTNAEYGQYQIDSLVERFRQSRELSVDEMNAQVEEARETWAYFHNGRKPSLSNVLSVLGIEMEEIVRWREQLFTPGKFIKKDKRLKNTMWKLSRHYALGVVTNNPVLVARKTLSALGVLKFFPIVVGLDTCMTPKPHEKPFIEFSALSGCPPETCVSIGDRYDIDLDIPLKLGMGAILVDGVEDVYQLPGVLVYTAERW
ncbi:MAG: HAD family hydrolase [Treponema sp.]|jgi:phosphoglycolate phosphatase/putative hydrolase of the HAD superfamily|nr:HAD family hydrolase [Treponema sp.]